MLSLLFIEVHWIRMDSRQLHYRTSKLSIFQNSKQFLGNKHNRSNLKELDCFFFLRLGILGTLVKNEL